MIRRAQDSDLPALGQLGARLMQVHYAFDPLRFLEPHEEAAKGYAAFLGAMLGHPESVIYVADENGEIAGYVFAALEPLSWKDLRGPAGFVHDLLVVEHARRSGLATALMQAALTWLRERGAPRAVLGTAAKNTTAQALFKRLGFRETMVEMTLEL